MKVLPIITSTSSDNDPKLSSTSFTKTIQSRKNGKSNIWISSVDASLIIGEHMSSSQKYFKKSPMLEIVSIPSTEQSSKQMNFLPKILNRSEVESRLYEFEKKYGLKSDEFYSKWSQGKAVDSLDSLKWATMYELWKEGYLA